MYIGFGSRRKQNSYLVRREEYLVGLGLRRCFFDIDGLGDFRYCLEYKR